MNRLIDNQKEVLLPPDWDNDANDTETSRSAEALGSR